VSVCHNHKLSSAAGAVWGVDLGETEEPYICLLGGGGEIPLKSNNFEEAHCKYREREYQACGQYLNFIW